MLKHLKSRKKQTLEQALDDTDAKLAMLNGKLAAQMVQLARQTNDLTPLKQAEEALLSARRYFGFENCPAELALVQQSLADTLLSLGRKQNNSEAISRARDSYRSAITLASMLGDDALRQALRRNLKTTDRILGLAPRTPSLFKVA